MDFRTDRIERQPVTAYIIKCGFGADNQHYHPQKTLVLFDRKVPRSPPLIIYAERYASP